MDEQITFLHEGWEFKGRLIARFKDKDDNLLELVEVTGNVGGGIYLVTEQMKNIYYLDLD